MLNSYDKERCSLGILYQVALIGSQSDVLQASIERKNLQIVSYMSYGVSKLFTALPPMKWCGIVWGKSSSAKKLFKIDPIEFPARHSPTITEIENKLSENTKIAIEETFEENLKVNDAETFSILVCHNKELAAKVMSLKGEEELEIEAGIQATSEFFEIEKVNGGKKVSVQRPCFQISKKYFKNGTLNNFEKKCLFPYWANGSENDFELSSSNTDQQIIDIALLTSSKDEKEIKKLCPTLISHLLEFKNLINDKINNSGRIGPWWKLQRNRKGRIYNADKVIIPQMINLGYDVNFYMDNTGIGVPFNCNVVWKKEGYREDWKESLIGWLHSGIVTFYLTALGGMKPRGNGELTGELLKELPIPKCIVIPSGDRNIEEAVKEIADIVRLGFKNDTHIKLDNSCWHLFNMLTQQNSTEVLYRDEWKQTA